MTEARSGFEAVTEARAREGLYSLVSRVFVKEVDQGFLRSLRDENILEAFSRELPGDLGSGKDEETIEELAVEYGSCFLSSGAFLSPYESVQASAEGLLCGEDSTRALALYKKGGFNMAEGCSLFADHFAVELEFMGHLCGMEASSLETGDMEGLRHAKRLQAEFMARHLGRWYRPFLQKVAQAVEHPFYRVITSITTEFLDSEQEYLRHESEDLLHR
jgi:TorA maturation chaperone TorD